MNLLSLVLRVWFLAENQGAKRRTLSSKWTSSWGIKYVTNSYSSVSIKDRI
jgi:hypothetical protein